MCSLPENFMTDAVSSGSHIWSHMTSICSSVLVLILIIQSRCTILPPTPILLIGNMWGDILCPRGYLVLIKLSPLDLAPISHSLCWFKTTISSSTFRPFRLLFLYPFYWCELRESHPLSPHPTHSGL